MARKILHVDANCFYAAVECQRRPELRNKPVAVCGSQEDRHGIVLTANYIAKPFGIRTGMAIWQAKQCCPNLVVLPPDMAEYARISKYAREIYEDYTDQVESFGLDEAWMDVTGSTGLYGDPMTIAREISRRVKCELGITVSIGVSFNKITAKLGSDYKKPDAITRIEEDNYKEIVYPLPAKDLLYVGPATAEKLSRMGITTIGRLAECPENILTYKFGKMGAVLRQVANGWDPTPVKRQNYVREVKSVGNSATTPRDLTCDEDVHLMLFLLAESVASRLREQGFRCMVVEVSVRDTSLFTFSRQHKLETPTASSEEIANTAYKLFKQNYRWTKNIRSIGIRGSELVDTSTGSQMSFFSNGVCRDKWERIDAAVDRLRQEYGYMSVRRAVTYTDPQLGSIDPRGHTVHSVGYFGG